MNRAVSMSKWYPKPQRWCQFAPSLLLCIAVCLLFVNAASAADLTVSVKDADQTPLSGINVYAYTQAGAYTGHYAVTDANGQAGFGDVSQFSAGSYKFKAVHLGYHFWVQNVDLPATTAVDLVIPTEPVTVTVTYAGQAAGNLKVYLFNDANAYLSPNAVTDANGQAVFVLPVDGTFNLRTDIMGSKYWSNPFQVVSGPNAVAIDAGGGQLSVTLQKEAANPMAGVKMYLFSPSGCYLGQSITTDSDGQGGFLVSSGTYRIRADYLGYQFWSADTTVSADTPLVFTIAHHETTLTVNGQVESAEPIAGAKVYLFTESGSYLGLNQVSDASGQVQFSLPDQPYKVRADYMNNQFWSDPFQFQDTTLTIPMAQAELSVVWGGMPLADVPVYLFTPGGSYTGVRMETGADGKAIFQVPAAAWKFRADYQTNTYWSADTDLPAGVRTPVELSTGGGTMTFTLFKNDSMPLEGVDCYAFNDAGAYTGLKSATNSQGQVFFDLAAGPYQIRVDYLGYQFWSEIYQVDTAMSDLFHIPHQDLTIAVNGLYDTPDPLQDVKVYLFTETGKYLSQNLTTDAAGQVVFNLPDKAFQVRADYMGQQFWSQPFNGQNSSVDIPMADARITVTGAGHAIQDVTVYAFTANQSYLNLKGLTDSSGNVDFRLPAGSYQFRTTCLGHTFWSGEVTLAAQTVQPVEIAAGGGAFTFTLLQNETDPLANTKCYLFSSDSSQYLGLWGLTDTNGQLNFDLVEGSYTIRADHLGYRYFSDPFQVPDTLDQVFTIAHQQVPITVKGVLGTATPLQGVKVYLFTPGGSYLSRNQVTDADGMVHFSLPAGEYKVRADYMNHKYWSPVFNQQAATVHIPLTRPRISVLGANEPLEGVKVYAFTESGSYVGLNTTTDDQGICTFVLPAERFKFRADYQGSKFWSDVIDFTSGPINAVTIDTGGGTFQLRVEKDPYHPLAELKCYAYSAAESYLGLFGTTDAQGRVTFKLADGAYKFKVQYAGYHFWAGPLTVDQDMSHTFTIPHLRRDLHVQGINPGPQPLQGLKAYLYTDGGAYIDLWSVTDADGHVAFDLPQMDYKAKVKYAGVDHWSPILQSHANLITINGDGTPVLPAPASLTAMVNGSDQIELSWSAPADTNGLTLDGYHLYRRQQCETAFQRINSALIAAGATTYTDDQVSPTGTYIYYIAAVSDTGIQGFSSPVATAGFGGEPTGENTTGIDGLTAAWQQGAATLSWSEQTGSTYQIYRGSSAAAILPWERTQTTTYSDADASPYQTWYYQVATVQTLCHPDTGQPMERIGPLSAPVTLAGLAAPLATPGIL